MQHAACALLSPTACRSAAHQVSSTAGKCAFACQVAHVKHAAVGVRRRTVDCCRPGIRSRHLGACRRQASCVVHSSFAEPGLLSLVHSCCAHCVIVAIISTSARSCSALQSARADCVSSVLQLHPPCSRMRRGGSGHAQLDSTLLMLVLRWYTYIFWRLACSTWPQHMA